MSFVKLIRNCFGEAMLVVGTGLFSYNILNFSFTDKAGGIFGRTLSNVAYYYTEISLLLIAIGAMLIVAGVLVIRNPNQTKL